MSTALQYFYVIFSKALDFVFNDMEIADGVTVGWVLVACLIFGVLIRSILNLPRSAPTQRGIRNTRGYTAKRKYYASKGVKY